MRKLGTVAILALSLLAGVFGLTMAGAPAPSAIQGGESVPEPTLETIAEPEASPSVDGAVNMVLYRIIVPPGVSVEAHDHYDAATWYIDSGSLTLTVAAGEVWVRQCDGGCPPSDTPPDPSTFELVELNTPVELQAGDWVIQHDTTTHAYENTGDTDAVILASATYYEALDGDATPASGPGRCAGRCK